MKNNIAFVFCLITLSAVCQSQDLAVNVSNVKNLQGSLQVALFNSKETFLKKPIAAQSVKVTGQQVKIVFNNIPAGDYAVSLYHDENENQKMDSNFIGIPKEGYGFSNNPSSMFGPPDYESARFNLAGPQSITVKLLYR
jgi:uncharacterized protein (DUF2141 family)